MVAMNDTTEWKDAVQAAAQKASEKYRSAAAFGREVNLSRNEIAAFLSKKHLEEGKLALLEKWLIDNEYLVRTPRAKELPTPYGPKLDAAWIAGHDMITMGLWLQSPDLTRKEKISRYKVWLDLARANLDKIIAVEQEGGK